MMQKKIIRTFLFLNFWTLVLDVITLVILSIILLTSLPLYIKLPLGLLFLYTLLKALELHIKIDDKYRARTILLAKNRAIFREDTFEKYMAAPCGRMLVKEVLLSLNKYYLYKTINKKYYKGFFADSKHTDIVIIPNPKKN